MAEIKAGIAKGKHAIVAITEHMCDVDELASYIEKRLAETRATVLGHIQRGGSPVPYDRILASRMGRLARLSAVAAGHGGRCVGIQNEKLVHHDIIDAIEKEASVQERPVDFARRNRLLRADNKRPLTGEGLLRRGRFIRYSAVFRQIIPRYRHTMTPEKKVTPPKLTRTSLSPMFRQPRRPE